MYSTFKRQTVFITSIAIASVVGGTTTAFVSAAIPSTTDNLIHGCYRNNTSLTDFKGTLRVVDSDNNEVCTAQETALNWNGDGLVNNLTGANFTNASLQYRNFKNRDLRNAVFDNANITGADFSASNLTGTKFLNTTRANTTFRGANLTNAVLEQYESPMNRRLGGIDMRNTRLSGATLIGVDGDFREASFTNANIKGFVYGNFSNIDFRQAYLIPQEGQNIGFCSTKLDNANFSGMTIGSLEVSSFTYFCDASLVGTNFANAQLNKVSFANAAPGETEPDRYSTAVGINFTGTKFNRVDLSYVDLSSAILGNNIWTSVTCPDGTNSDNNGNTCIGHLVP